MVFAPASVEVARQYELDVLADPRAGVFKAIGTERASPVGLITKGMAGAVKSLRQGLVPHATKADMLRLGADAAVDAEGEIVLLHLAKDADDRLPPERLVSGLADRRWV